MLPLYNDDAPKKATNLSINSDLLKRSRALNINLSAALEQTLRAALAESETEKWKQENRKAITDYNGFVTANGCFGDEYRNF